MIENTYFFKVPFMITGECDFKKSKASVKAFYFTLCRLAFIFADKKTGWFFHNMKKLAQESGLSLKTIVEAKKELIRLKLIECKKCFHPETMKRSADSYKINGLEL